MKKYLAILVLSFLLISCGGKADKGPDAGKRPVKEKPSVEVKVEETNVEEVKVVSEENVEENEEVLEEKIDDIIDEIEAEIAEEITATGETK